MTGHLTGRIGSGPHGTLRTEVLEPQLRFELEHLLPWYIRLEKVLLVEYRRMELLEPGDVTRIAAVLDTATPQAIAGFAPDSMSDMAFTLERFVEHGLERTPPAWHVDRSRNDLQAAAQMLFARDQVLDVASWLSMFGRAARKLAASSADVLMPGYTHGQAAQAISAGFYLSALVEQVLHTLRRWERVYATADTSPMGAGSMAGQELPWDRERMARLLGCSGVQRHALRAVASRDWSIEIAAELSLLGVALSRFATDLMAWGGTEHGFIDLPDELSGISSAMPQKKNFPVLERIRARTAHLGAGYVAVAFGHRGTPYSNTVEVSKEAGAQVPALIDIARSTLRLFTVVLDNLRFRTDRMRDAVETEYLGGFTLANLLTMQAGVPWRTSQIIAGKYVVAATAAGLRPSCPDPSVLVRLAAQHGHALTEAATVLHEAFDVSRALTTKCTPGSTNPDAVRAMTAEQLTEYDHWDEHWARHRQRITEGLAELDRLVRSA